MSIFWPLWYESHRAHIKDIVDTGQNIIAKTQLETMIQEHSSWLTELGNPKNRIYGEQLMMEHALRHLDSIIEQHDPQTTDSPFTDSDGQVKHQSDIVKETLLKEPKSDYT
jgi:hypothetical protein